MKKSNLITIAFGLIVLLAGNAWAKDVKLAWDANPEADVVGYKVYYNTYTSTPPFDATSAKEGPSPIDVGNKLTMILTGLPDGDTHYFAVTAYNADGLESPFSNVVASDWVPKLFYPQEGDAVAPSEVVFSWGNAPADASVTYTIYYGTDPNLTATALASRSSQASALLAGAALFGLLGAALPSRRLKVMTALVLLAATLLVWGCGGGGGSGSDPAPVTSVNPGSDDGTPGTDPGSNPGSDPGTNPSPVATQAVSDIAANSYTARDLQPSTTYYWKVVATDVKGDQRESVTGKFTTGNF